MDKVKELNTRENIKIVTSNEFIMALGLENLSLKARKLLYIVIAQCKKNDKNFFMYEVSVKKLSEMLGITRQAIYAESYRITYELLHAILRVKTKGEKSYEQYTLFSKCSYQEREGIFKVKLNPDMTEFLLELNKEFTQPFLNDFLKMRSIYTMEIWHLMQREMNSKKPGLTNEIVFNLGLDELRSVTGTQNKLNQLCEFKSNCLDKAIQEIKEQCGVVVTYKNIKEGKKVTGFTFTAVSTFHVDEKEIDSGVKTRTRMGVLKMQNKVRKLSKEEQEEYDKLVENSEQLCLAL